MWDGRRGKIGLLSFWSGKCCVSRLELEKRYCWYDVWNLPDRTSIPLFFDCPQILETYVFPTHLYHYSTKSQKTFLIRSNKQTSVLQSQASDPEEKSSRYFEIWREFQKLKKKFKIRPKMSRFSVPQWRLCKTHSLVLPHLIIVLSIAKISLYILFINVKKP